MLTIKGYNLVQLIGLYPLLLKMLGEYKKFFLTWNVAFRDLSFWYIDEYKVRLR